MTRRSRRKRAADQPGCSSRRAWEPCWEQGSSRLDRQLLDAAAWVGVYRLRVRSRHSLAEQAGVSPLTGRSVSDLSRRSVGAGEQRSLASKRWRAYRTAWLSVSCTDITGRAAPGLSLGDEGLHPSAVVERPTARHGGPNSTVLAAAVADENTMDTLVIAIPRVRRLIPELQPPCRR
jgi:hypothetical protein